ncbi:MAG TPA: hypothetical protein VM537_12560 [Anaerolineae bacterium]|nr:hypothetical protein [Anaerolineae bacterium]
MGDPAKRIDNWVAKVTPERTSSTVAARISEMAPNFAGTANELLQMEQQVRQVLNAAGVPTITYPFYLNFGRELWSLNRKGIAGESLALEAATLIAKWVAQGLTQSVLQGIRTNVFNVSAPVAP